MSSSGSKKVDQRQWGKRVCLLIVKAVDNIDAIISTLHSFQNRKMQESLFSAKMLVGETLMFLSTALFEVKVMKESNLKQESVTSWKDTKNKIRDIDSLLRSAIDYSILEENKVEDEAKVEGLVSHLVLSALEYAADGLDAIEKVYPLWTEELMFEWTSRVEEVLDKVGHGISTLEKTKEDAKVGKSSISLALVEIKKIVKYLQRIRSEVGAIKRDTIYWKFAIHYAQVAVRFLVQGESHIAAIHPVKDEAEVQKLTASLISSSFRYMNKCLYMANLACRLMLNQLVTIPIYSQIKPWQTLHQPEIALADPQIEPCEEFELK
jgi:hypothetical protein